MVCIMCLLPLFLVPIVNILPLLFYSLMGKICALFGWEYRKQERAPPACPYKSPATKDNPNQLKAENETKIAPPVLEPVAEGTRNTKQD